VDKLLSLDAVNKALALEDIFAKDKQYYAKGDTVDIVLEDNSYFKVEYYQDQKQQFTLYPMSQPNPTMGLISSPDSKNFLTRDLYTHVSAINDYDEPECKEDELYEVAPGEQFFINDFVTNFEGGEVLDEVDGYELQPNDI